MTTTLTKDNFSDVGSIAIDWQAVITADGSTGTNAVSGQGYFIDTTSAAHTITLPSSPSIGDSIAIKDYAGTFGTNALTISRNGSNIQGAGNNSELSTNRASVILVYVDSTKGWLFTKESNVADLRTTEYVAATGGSVSTSGDYKIHSFTGDGTFCVSNAGNPLGNDTVEVLVIAGGGAGGGGGGGGGGLQEGTGITVPNVSPLSFPVTVGAGGSAATNGSANTNNTCGSNSVINFNAAITSVGGGKGGASVDDSRKNGSPGGSGGGAANFGCGGSANTTPSNGATGYGNAGADFPPNPYPNGSGGGGGAGSAGNPGSFPGSNFVQGGPGGNGRANSITGSPVTYAGGGGGQTYTQQYSGAAGTGGSGGGGNGGNFANPGGTPAQAGTANLGGGGGGGNAVACSTPGAGGKGVVVIKYKFQN